MKFATMIAALVFALAAGNAWSAGEGQHEHRGQGNPASTPASGKATTGGGMMNNMGGMMGDMTGMMGNMSKMMEQNGGQMDTARMKEMAKIMNEMSGMMGDMSKQMQKGRMDPAMQKHMQERMADMHTRMQQMHSPSRQ